MFDELDKERSSGLLVEALGSELVDRWVGEAIIRHLNEIGCGDQVSKRLATILEEIEVDSSHQEILMSLITLNDNLRFLTYRS